jgi:hypothetical protein
VTGRTRRATGPTVRRVVVVATALALASGITVSCSDQAAVPPVDPSEPANSSIATERSNAADSTSEPARAASDESVSSDDLVSSGSDADGIVIDTAGATVPFDRRLLGTNAPAWISPDRMADPVFRQQLVDMGTTVLRMPGGSWSNSYDWLACENADATKCSATWAATPSDYVQLLAATGIEGMWTVSFSGTAEEAAALVAFFNGDVDDERPIGTDKQGTDWGTVGKWARLRAEHGSPEPQRVDLWEVGNEIYGAVQSAGEACAPWGWEDVWTCDPADYVNGDDEHDGFVQFREAMLAVDPDIEVGAVGIGGAQEEWSAWGDTVIEQTPGEMDFYVVHSYGFDQAPDPQEVLRRPSELWSSALGDARDTLAEHNPDAAVPIAITEYNLFSFADGDTDGLMAEAVNALFIADTIGQMAVQGASMANQWNLVNGLTASGSDYGIFEPDRNEPNPQFYALALWSRFGDEMVPVESEFDASDTLAVYAGRHDDGTVSLLTINKTSQPIESPVLLGGSTGSFTASADVMQADSLESATVTYNGASEQVTDIDSEPGADLGDIGPGDALSASFAPHSITLLRFTPVG